MKRPVMIALAAVALLLIAYAVWDYSNVDSCLDAGGSWDWSAGRCMR